MLGIDRRTLQAAWTLFLFALVLIVIYNIGRTLIIFALALIFAHLLAPVVNFVERLFPTSVPRVASLALVYVALIAVLVATLIPLGSKISEEATALALKVPDALKGDPLANLPFPRWIEPFRGQVTQFIRDWFSAFGQQIGPRLASAGTSLIRGIGSVLGTVLIPILAFFFLKDGTHMRDAVVDSICCSRSTSGRWWYSRSRRSRSIRYSWPSSADLIRCSCQASPRPSNSFPWWGRSPAARSSSPPQPFPASGMYC